MKNWIIIVLILLFTLAGAYLNQRDYYELKEAKETRND